MDDHPGADRNLLYGVLALQMGFVGREALLAAMVAWVPAKGKPLAQVLIEQGSLQPEDHPAIAQVVARLLERNGDDPARSLAALDFTLAEPVRDLLLSIDDPDVRASLASLDPGAPPRARPDPDATTVWGADARPGPTPDGPAVDHQLPDGSRFRILRPHAKGGLGEVSVAWDEELGRQVALKEIRPEHGRNPRLRERFVREAEVNGNLEHPGIVPVYGRGSYPDGRPYYAMRFVEGETLQRALERFHDRAPELGATEWGLGLRALLRRLLVVCEAIEYAHSRGVLHRDLKPSNILLGRFGETLIIDWGLAKLLGQPPDETDLPPSESGSILRPASGVGVLSTVAGETLGSPPYMSPEQAAGRLSALGPASDVYSLGATLYAVLTGKPPVVAPRTSEILERVRLGAITPPATANPRVPRALEAVCLKAMRLEPADRYATARALADDLERWLDDQPVSVFADPLSTRMLRWSRHHRTLVATGLTLAVATVVALAATTAVVNDQRAQAVEAREKAVIARMQAENARDQAEEARRRASDHLRVGLGVVDQLVTLGDRQLIAQQTTVERNRFLEPALSFIREFRAREPGDFEVQVQSAQIARRLANLYRLTGRFEQADRLYSEALAAFEGLHARAPSEPRYADLLAEARIDASGAWLLAGRPREAEAAARQALDLARAQARALPGRPRFGRTLGRALAQLAAAHVATGQADAADLAREAAATLEPLAEAALPGVREAVQQGRVLPLADQLEWVQALGTLSEGLARAGRPGEAEEPLRRALGRMRQLTEQFDGLDVPDVPYDRAWIETLLARSLAEGPGGGEELALLEDAVARLLPLTESRREVLPFRMALADALSARARAHARGDRLDLAEADARDAEARLRDLVGEFPASPDAASLMAEVQDTLGRVALRRGPDHAAEARDRAASAVQYAQAAARLNPDNAAYRARLEAYRARLSEPGPAPGVR